MDFGLYASYKGIGTQHPQCGQVIDDNLSSHDPTSNPTQSITWTELQKVAQKNMMDAFSDCSSDELSHNSTEFDNETNGFNIEEDSSVFNCDNSDDNDSSDNNKDNNNDNIDNQSKITNDLNDSDYYNIFYPKMFELPTIPDSDIKFAFGGIPSYFGRNNKDTAWNAFATRFYNQLEFVNKIITYWQNLIVNEHDQWAIVFKNYMDDCTMVHQSKILKDKLNSNQRKDLPHISSRECLLLNPLNTHNELHFCYGYWLKVMITVSMNYKILWRFYLAASTTQNFTKIVVLEPTKYHDTDEYLPKHQTSMQMALCLELMRLRIIYRSPLLFPLTDETNIYHTNELHHVLNYARRVGYLRSQMTRKNPIILAQDLASDIILEPTGERKYKTLMAAPITIIENGINKTKKIEVSIEDEVQMSHNIASLILKKQISPMSVIEECISGVLWRLPMCWHNEQFHNYLELLFDKIALFFIGNHLDTTMDDFAFRNIPARLTKVQSSIVLQMRTDLNALMKEEQFNINNEDGDCNSGNFDESKILLKNFLDELDDQQHNLNNGTQNEDFYTVNAHFLYYASIVTNELGFAMYNHTQFAHVKWTPSGTTQQDKQFKMNYFLCLRGFLKIWCRHKLTTPHDITRDTVEDKFMVSILRWVYE